MAFYTVYFAGELFDHKHLTGNALLAEAIDTLSRGRYRCVLPQDIEHPEKRSRDIRNRDLQAVLECDLALFNFDGTELDSGTVAEFMLAKFLDIPAVVLRSDFRGGGDQSGGEPWNLMCSFYPRTETLVVNGMELYQQARGSGDLPRAVAAFYRELAGRVVERLESVRCRPPLTEGQRQRLEALYDWALRFPGAELAEQCGGPEFVARLVERKLQKGLA